MRIVLWSVILAALLAGCSTTNEERVLLQRYEKKKHYHKKLLKTEKVQLYEGDLTKVMLTATYLNTSPVKEDAREDERFVVGLYVDDETEASRAFDFNLTLNGREPKSITPLKQGDRHLKEISFVTEWNRFFLVTFPYVEEERFDLLFESEKYGKGRLNFAKKAKYTFTKKAS